MSGFVHYHGKVREIKARQTKSIEDICKDLIDKHGMEMKDDYETHKEFVQDNLYKYYMFAGDRLFEIIESEEFWGCMYNAEQNEDGTIDFNVRYNNSSEGLGDALENALKECEL